MRGRAEIATVSLERVRNRWRGPSSVCFAATFSREGRRGALSSGLMGNSLARLDG